MAYEFKGRVLNKIGVIGSGQIGPDIALYFAKVFYKHNVPVVIVDIDQGALDRGEAKFAKKIARGQKSGHFSDEMATAMLENSSFTSDYDQLKGADFIVEAATEDQGLKGKIFTQLEALCGPDTIFASNSSHLEPEEIFAPIEHKNRSVVIHYFFPAERNMMVEIVPGKDTDPATAQWLLDFYESIGKCPIRVGSRYGYAIDPIFEGIFVAAAKLVEDGLGTTKEIDAVTARTLGLTVGPFTAMNLTGGNPITHHGCSNYIHKIMPWFASPKILGDRVESGEPWEVPGRGEVVELDKEREQKIADLMLGAYFGLVGEVLDSGITNIADFEMGLEVSLDLTPPFRLMNETGVAKSFELIENYASKYDGFTISKSVAAQAKSGENWHIPVLEVSKQDGVAIVKIRRPRVLNALNQDVFDQLKATFTELENDDSVQASVLTSFGVKAFVSGADVNFLAAIKSKEEGEATSLDSQSCLNLIEGLSKPVVCAMNGLAFGGGMELAMSCSTRICKKGLRPLGAQPEVNLGIIPGAGATQRLPRLIGVEQAALLLRKGRAFSSTEAVEMGLIREEVEGDLIDAAVALAKQVANGDVEIKKIETGPIDAPEQLPEVDLKHLSTAVDALLCKAILEGAKGSLEDGLKLEAKTFGEVCDTEDMRIGVSNFINNGPRAKAEFVNR